ncbi:hypothetical protein [uncultured Amnibacterium sp.]|uniref:hypothetical protein n=1 Tax=uncultured Amnibacterium sp. TaxID=1631851 RepID=UPI0035CC955B
MTDPGVVVLVEGRSDAAVVRLLAARRSIAEEGWLLLPTGGAMGASRALRTLAARPPVVLGLGDAGEAAHLRLALTGADDALFVCDPDPDLEHELLRALGERAVLEVLGGTGDLRSFRTLQGQPQHRGHAWQQQAHRFLGAGSGRKERIDAALAARLEPGAEPPPLRALLDRLASLRPDSRPAAARPPADGASAEPA